MQFNKLAFYLEIVGKVVLLAPELMFMNRFMTKSSKAVSNMLRTSKLAILKINQPLKVPSSVRNNSKEFYTTLRWERKKKRLCVVGVEDGERKVTLCNLLSFLVLMTA